MLAGLQFVGGIMQSNNSGNIQRSGNDRSVRRATAQVGGNPEHEFSIHCRRVGRRQIVSDQNVRFTGGQERFGTFTLQIANNPTSDVLNIQGPLAQVWVVDFTQRFGVTGGDLLKNRFDVAMLALKFA